MNVMRDKTVRDTDVMVYVARQNSHTEITHVMYGPHLDASRCDAVTRDGMPLFRSIFFMCTDSSAAATIEQDIEMSRSLGDDRFTIVTRDMNGTVSTKIETL